MSTEISKVMREIPVWGTIVFIECDGPDKDLLETGIDKCAEFFKEVDEVFSTYKTDSQVSKLRRGEIEIGDCTEDLQKVWQLCLKAKEITDGSFDPWCVEGGFDPSGYVKGWASDKAIEILRGYGAIFIQVNGAGDLSLFGGPHKIGIRSPEDEKVILKIFELDGGAIATSGTYERGAHIRDPHTGLIAIGARSATVVGPDGGLADALATALIVSGRDGAIWFAKPELSEYHAWVIDRHDDVAWSVGYGHGRD
ncbi:Flavin transferase ApbE [actinobacterium SCGC AAA044-D11]